MRTRLVSLSSVLSVASACTGVAPEAAAGRAPTGTLKLSLTVPDGSAIQTVSYTVSGPALTTNRSGTVNVGNSNPPLRLRVGALPVASGYTMTLAATTSAGVTCAGQGTFSIGDALTSALAMRLVCGAGVSVQRDDRGDVRASVDVVIAARISCPVVTGISALPAETELGGNIELEGFSSSTDAVTYEWAADSGAFSSTSGASARYTCSPGPYYRAITLTARKAGCPDASHGEIVTCGPPPTPTPIPTPAPAPTPIP